MTSSASASAPAIAERSTRCGAWGHITEKASVRQVSAADDARSAFTYAGCAPDSVAATKRVPTRAAPQPQARTAARLGSLHGDEVAARAVGRRGLRERPDPPARPRP